MAKDLYDIGELPPIGEVPAQMHAMTVRPDAFGEPAEAIRDEVIDVPELGPRDVLVAAMAAGVNFNNVWAARGHPGRRDEGAGALGRADRLPHRRVRRSRHRLRGRQRRHERRRRRPRRGARRASGIWTTPGSRRAAIPAWPARFRVWGYDSCWGSFAQFTKVQAHQCLPKADHLTWEEAAAPTLTGGTAYRMLFGWAPNTVQPGDSVLVWGGSGGLGSLAIQLVANAGGRAVAVVSSDEKGEYCKTLGAVGFINRKTFDHWGVPPAWDSPEWKGWFDGAKAFGKAFWDALGEKASPRIVFEHPGQDTIPTSNFVVRSRRHGRDLRGHHRLRHDDRRAVPLVHAEALPGLAPLNDEQAIAFNDLVREGKIVTTLGHTYTYPEIPLAHQLMADGKLPEGNVSCLVNAATPGLTGVS